MGRLKSIFATALFISAPAISSAFPSLQPRDLGINCRGSGRCVLRDCGDDAIAKLRGTLEWSIDQGYGDTFYKDGQRIACHWHCCAFYQNAAGTVKDTLMHVKNLQDHGCDGCGSDPIHPGGYVKDGELTVNYVDSVTGCMEGHLCPPEPNYKCNWDSITDGNITVPEGTEQDCDITHSPDPPSDCGWPSLQECGYERHPEHEIP